MRSGTWRSRLLVIAFALMAGASVACKDGSSPSGSGSLSQPGTGGPTRTNNFFRAVAFREGDIMPGSSDTVWVFFEDPGTLNFGTLDIEVNGNPVGNGNLNLFALGVNAQVAFLDAQVAPVPAIATIQVIADDNQGNPVGSNFIRTQPGPVNGTPFPNTHVPPAFKTVSPKDGDTAVATGPPLQFNTIPTHTGTYLILVEELGLDNQGNTVILDLPVVVEVTGGVFMVGSTGAASTEYANALLKNATDFLWHVVALNGDGWGVGTTIDVPGFNTGGQNPPQAVLETWPLFTTQ